MLSPGYLGCLLIQANCMATAKKENFLVQLDVSFRGNKFLKKWVFFDKMSHTEQNLGLQKPQLRYVKVVTDVLLKP